MTRTLLALREANHGFGVGHTRDTSLDTGTARKRGADGSDLLTSRALYGVRGLATAAGASASSCIEGDVHHRRTFFGHLREALLAFKDRDGGASGASHTMNGQAGADGVGAGRATTAGLGHGGCRSKGQGGQGGGDGGTGERTEVHGRLLKGCQVEVWKLPRWRPPESPAEARALKVGAFLN